VEVLALSPFFWKGLAVVVSGVILFLGSVYLLMAAVFGRRMGYLVLAVSLFGWMIILSAIWTFPIPGTPKNLGPRGTEPHWKVFAAATQPVESDRFPVTAQYPNDPWRPITARTQPSADTVTTAVQNYLAARANEQLGLGAEAATGDQPAIGPGGPGGGEEATTGFAVQPSMFTVQDIHFATGDDGTFLAAAQAFFQQGGPRITVFVLHDPGNVPVYSWLFLAASIIGFAIHVPLLDRAERKREAILTGGTAPAWYGPA
jgi:hypothetical protein